MEPLNTYYDYDAAAQAVAESLTCFYDKLTQKLDTVDIYKVLKKKNIYLYRAKGVSSASEICESILSAFVSSSEETIFGNEFFEPLAIVLSGGQKAMTEGADITVDKNGAIFTIAVKSGTSVFNSDSRKRQEQNFASAQRRAQQARKAFVPVIGYGYGVKRLRAGSIYQELAGQDFWYWLTGDEDFYIRIIDLMGTKPDEYADIFRGFYTRALNRMIRDFTVDFCDDRGDINWEKLIQYNSGRR